MKPIPSCRPKQKMAAELKARGEAAKILENGRATAEAVQLMHAQSANGNTRELFLIQMLPDLLNMVTKVLADNLHIEKLTVIDPEMETVCRNM